MKTSKQDKDLIKSFESFSPTAYWDVDGYSIGYGHHGAHAGQTISQAEAEKLMDQDLQAFERTINSINPNLSQSQFDAAVSLCYNIGTTRFSNSNTAMLIASDPTPRPELEQEWKEWRLAGGVVNQNLVNRRAKEWELYAKASIKTNILAIAALTAVVAASGALLLATN